MTPPFCSSFFSYSFPFPSPSFFFSRIDFISVRNGGWSGSPLRVFCTSQRVATFPFPVCVLFSPLVISGFRATDAAALPPPNPPLFGVSSSTSDGKSGYGSSVQDPRTFPFRIPSLRFGDPCPRTFFGSPLRSPRTSGPLSLCFSHWCCWPLTTVLATFCHQSSP